MGLVIFRGLTPFAGVFGVWSACNLSCVRLWMSDLVQIPVVGASCLGVSHPLFAYRYFDVVIVDEASQVTEPVRCSWRLPHLVVVAVLMVGQWWMAAFALSLTLHDEPVRV